MSDRDQLKKELMFTEDKKARNKLKRILLAMQRNYMSVKRVENNKGMLSIWCALNTFAKGAPLNYYLLSVAEALVKSQDSSDSDKQYSRSKRLVDFCQQKTERTNSLNVPLMAVHEMGKISLGWTAKSLPDLTKSAVGCLNKLCHIIYCRVTNTYF